jgi:hypothetical protein
MFRDESYSEEININVLTRQNQVFILERCPLFRESYVRGFSYTPHIMKEKQGRKRFTYFAQFDSVVWQHVFSTSQNYTTFEPLLPQRLGSYNRRRTYREREREPLVYSQQ